MARDDYKKEASKRDIAKQLVTYNEETHMVGESLTEHATFLHAGIPLNKLDVFRVLF